MNSSQRFQRLRALVSVGHPASCGVAWLLLSAVCSAADVGHESPVMHWLHVAGMNLNTIMAAVWVFVLGSCIGSFLNVVIYRMPAGMALSHPGSRCPSCETELTARDNIPVLGWIVLRGRCRYCQNPVSSRYPLIETLVGLLFLALLLVETCTSASNLPFHPPVRFYGGVVDLIYRFGRWDLLASYCYHAFYLTILLAVCMIGYDGHCPPRRLLRVGILTGLIAGIWPILRPVPALIALPAPLLKMVGGVGMRLDWLHVGTLHLGPALAGIVDGLLGLLSGLFTGWLAARSASGSRCLAETLRGVLVLVGVYCGWQMTWSVLLIVMIGLALLRGRLSARSESMFLLGVFAVCCSLLFGWASLLNGVILIRYDGWQWSGLPAWIDWMVTIAVITALALVSSRRNGEMDPEADHDPEQSSETDQVPSGPADVV